jgi:hypothetical protein
LTETRLIITYNRIESYWNEHGRVPSRADELPQQNGRDCALADGWGRRFDWESAGKATVRVSSFGRDGKPGGSGDDADMTVVFVGKRNDQHDFPTIARDAIVRRSDKELILDAVLHDILSNPNLKNTREFYGTPGEKQVALVTNRGYGVPWPADYRPVIAGWTVSRVEEGDKRDADKPRLLGIRIDKYSQDHKERVDLFNAPIAVTVLNAGGHKNGAVIGGCSVNYSPKQVSGKWVVEFEGLLDP